MVSCSGFRVSGTQGFKASTWQFFSVQDSGFEVSGLGSRVRVLGAGPSVGQCWTLTMDMSSAVRCPDNRRLKRVGVAQQSSASRASPSPPLRGSSAVQPPSVAEAIRLMCTAHRGASGPNDFINDFAERIGGRVLTRLPCGASWQGLVPVPLWMSEPQCARACVPN